MIYPSVILTAAKEAAFGRRKWLVLAFVQPALVSALGLGLGLFIVQESSPRFSLLARFVLEKPWPNL